MVTKCDSQFAIFLWVSEDYGKNEMKTGKMLLYLTKPAIFSAYCYTMWQFSSPAVFFLTSDCQCTSSWLKRREHSQGNLCEM